MSQQLFIVFSTPTTKEVEVQEAIEILKAIGEVAVEQRPKLFSEWYQCPALKVPSGRMIFGIDGIRMFVERGGVESASEAQPQARAGRSF